MQKSSQITAPLNPPKRGKCSPLLEGLGEAVYYPFGSPLKSRSYVSEGYRFGFNSFEKDDELKGEGNHISFGDYGYDPRVVVRWRPDPFAAKYPSLSPYAAFANNPIVFIDIDGKDIERSTGFLNSDYNKVYEFLMQKTGYKEMLGSFVDNKKFNLKMDVDGSKIPPGAGGYTAVLGGKITSEKVKGIVVRKTISAEVEQNFLPGETNTGVDLWKLYIVVHEGVHAAEVFHPDVYEKSQSSHNGFMYLQSLFISIFTEINNELNLGLEIEEIMEISFYGAGDSEVFQQYVKGKSDANKTTIEEEINALNQRIEETMQRVGKIELPTTNTDNGTKNDNTPQTDETDDN